MDSIKKICVFSNYNQYESKRHFCLKFAEALRRNDIDVMLIDDDDLATGKEFVARMGEFKPDLTCAFNRFAASDGSFWWDVTKSPHLSILVDPSYYDMNIIKSPYSLVSCVDQYDVCKLQRQGFDRVFFWPHGVERDLYEDPAAERSYDAVMVGTCYDPDSLREYWKKNAPTQMIKVIEDAIDLVLADKTIHFEEAAKRSMEANRMPLDSPHAPFLPYFIDYYSRGMDRLALIRSIKDVKVHVFGDPCWRNILPVQGWEHYLADDPNVVLNPGVTYPESLEIFKRSKICLNSMPMFKSGSHERIFNALACGCAVATSESTYLRSCFTDSDGVLFYQYPKLDLLNDLIVDRLQNPKTFLAARNEGQAKVFREHTWDVRAKSFLENLNLLITKVPC